MGSSPITAPAHHFGSAKGLLGVIATNGFEELADEMEAALETGEADPASKLRALCHAYIDFALSRPERFRLMFGPSPPTTRRGEPLAVPSDRALQILQREVAALRAEERAARALTVSTWSFVHGLAMLLLLLDGRLALLEGEDGSPDRSRLIADALSVLDLR